MENEQGRNRQWVRQSCVAFTFVAASGLLAGCGGEDEKVRRPESMLGGASAAVEPESRSGVNTPPTIESVEFTPSRPSVGRTIVARARAEDEDGDATRLSYRWTSSDGTVLGEGPRFDTDGLSPGESVSVLVVANDGQDESEAYSESIRMAEAASQVAIVAIDTSEGTDPGALLSAYFESTGDGFSDSDAEYEWEVNGERVSSEEELDTAAYSPGDRVTLRARIGGEGARFVRSRPVQLGRGDAPEIVSQPLAGIEGGVFRYQMRAKSPSSKAELSFELLKGPEGMSVGPESGLVEWRPDRAQRGRFEVEVAVKDQWGSGVAQSFAIEAAAPTAPPARRR
ncbi:MAG: hypothetical protein AB8G23_15380 [Myxococcota bacterium]